LTQPLLRASESSTENSSKTCASRSRCKINHNEQARSLGLQNTLKDTPIVKTDSFLEAKDYQIDLDNREFERRRHLEATLKYYRHEFRGALITAIFYLTTSITFTALTVTYALCRYWSLTGLLGVISIFLIYATATTLKYVDALFGLAQRRIK